VGWQLYSGAPANVARLRLREIIVETELRLLTNLGAAALSPKLCDVRRAMQHVATLHTTLQHRTLCCNRMHHGATAAVLLPTLCDVRRPQIVAPDQTRTRQLYCAPID
jgi:hypothetical protein